MAKEPGISLLLDHIHQQIPTNNINNARLLKLNHN
jgi:hypothetical protein